MDKENTNMDKKINLINENLQEIFAFLNIQPSISVIPEEDIINVVIEGEQLNFLIGYRGETLDALQNYLGLVANKDAAEWIRVAVDINDYRKQRIQKIEDIARSFIDRARFFGQAVELPPMNSFERFRVHTFVSEYDDIVSESVGESFNRRVVLKPLAK